MSCAVFLSHLSFAGSAFRCVFFQDNESFGWGIGDSLIIPFWPLRKSSSNFFFIGHGQNYPTPPLNAFGQPFPLFLVFKTNFESRIGKTKLMLSFRMNLMVEWASKKFIIKCIKFFLWSVAFDIRAHWHTLINHRIMLHNMMVLGSGGSRRRTCVHSCWRTVERIDLKSSFLPARSGMSSAHCTLLTLQRPLCSLIMKEFLFFSGTPSSIRQLSSWAGTSWRRKGAPARRWFSTL